MTSDMPDRQKPSPEMQHQEGVELHTGDRRKPADIPVFNCIVYVSPEAGGGVRARVANLPELECTAATEREALGKIVPAFKERVGELMHRETPIPWIEPPSLPEPGEQKRFIPVHL
jgi:hypothetical protein